jgi:hypothetical protein
MARKTKIKTKRKIRNKRKTTKRTGGQPTTPTPPPVTQPTMTPNNNIIIPQPNNNITDVAMNLDHLFALEQGGGNKRKTTKRRGGQPTTPTPQPVTQPNMTPNNTIIIPQPNNNITDVAMNLDHLFALEQGGGNKRKKNKLEQKKEFITHTFLEMLDTIKLYHWKTNSYSHHKSTDELHERLQHKTDKFIEIMLGKSKTRINNIDKHIKLYNLNNKNFNDKLYKYRTLLIEMDNYLDYKKDTDLMNIRDEMIGEINHYLYKSTFK